MLIRNKVFSGIFRNTESLELDIPKACRAMR